MNSINKTINPKGGLEQKTATQKVPQIPSKTYPKEDRFWAERYWWFYGTFEIIGRVSNLKVAFHIIYKS
jgi:hypothetical protein